MRALHLAFTVLTMTASAGYAQDSGLVRGKIGSDPPPPRRDRAPQSERPTGLALKRGRAPVVPAPLCQDKSCRVMCRSNLALEDKGLPSSTAAAFSSIQTRIASCECLTSPSGRGRSASVKSRSVRPATPCVSRRRATALQDASRL